MSLTDVNNNLAINLHRLLAEENGNVLFCPFSISTAMAMLLCAAEGDTESEMRAALGYDFAGIKRDEIASAFKQQMSLLLKNRNSHTLLSANSMLIQKKFEIKRGYKKILAKSFKALISEVDFENKIEKVVKKTNNWVKKKTQNKIPELVQSFDPDTAIILLNAVYFKGTWLKQFKKRNTYPQNFYNKGSGNNIKRVDMMHITKQFPLYRNKTFQALQLPYIGKEAAMLILLPLKKNGLESMEAGLAPSFLQDIKQNSQTMEVEVSIPKFRLEYAKNLIPCLQRLGINRVFKRGAELGVASDSKKLSVSEVLHKVVLKVNEKGTEATALMMIGMVFDCCRPVFVVDHPFVFIIYDTRSDLILFMGRVDEL